MGSDRSRTLLVWGMETSIAEKTRRCSQPYSVNSESSTGERRSLRGAFRIASSEETRLLMLLDHKGREKQSAPLPDSRELLSAIWTDEDSTLISECGDLDCVFVSAGGRLFSLVRIDELFGIDCDEGEKQSSSSLEGSRSGVEGMDDRIESVFVTHGSP
jgi:hypothetical protein